VAGWLVPASLSRAEDVFLSNALEMKSRAANHTAPLIDSELTGFGRRIRYLRHDLPPYRPNLNPKERLWKVINEHGRNNRYFATAEDFRWRINNFFDVTLPNIDTTLGSRINGNFKTFKFSS
jgi:hypothetical protein